MRRSPRRRSRTATVWFALAVGLAAVTGCGRDSQATVTTMDEREAAETLSTNPFLPEDANIGDCVSSLPRPGCGSEIRGDSHAAITFGVLVAALSFIGWRIVRSVRRRDRTSAPSADTAS